jgi:hypothetical protein
MRTPSAASFASLLAVALLSGCAAGGARNSAVPPAAAVGPSAHQRSTIYVAEPAAVVGFPATASGDVAPSVTIAGSNTLLGTHPMTAITHDPAGNLYVAAFNGEGNDPIYEFAAGANGNVAPIREIDLEPVTGQGSPSILYPVSIAVDADGYLYVGASIPFNSGNVVITTEVDVYAPGASGSVQPIAVLNANAFGSLWVALDAAQDLYTAGRNSQYPGVPGTSVDEFAPAASGNGLLRKSPSFTYAESPGASSIAVSPVSGNVYLGTVASNQATVYVGNPALTKLVGSIGGAATRFGAVGRTILEGAFGDDGEFYVLSAANANSPEIDAFAPNANGNVAPQRRLTGAALDSAFGITVVPALN